MRLFDTKYVFSFDPDDVLQPDFLEKCVAYMEKHPEKAAVATWLDRFGVESGISKLSEQLATLPSMLITNNYLGSCLLRKEVFVQVGGYDTAKVVYGAEDYDFWLSTLEKGWSLGVIPEPLFRYRRLSTSSSSQSAKPEKAVKWRRYIVEKHVSLYREYLVDVIVGFEKRASDAHVGYLETRYQLDRLSKDYETLHSYVEDDLLPQLRRHEVTIQKLNRFSPKHYVHVIRKKISGK
jgi:GT2 family glycosyltransferase